MWKRAFNVSLLPVQGEKKTSISCFHFKHSPLGLFLLLHSGEDARKIGLQSVSTLHDDLSSVSLESNKYKKMFRLQYEAFKNWFDNNVAIENSSLVEHMSAFSSNTDTEQFSSPLLTQNITEKSLSAAGKTSPILLGDVQDKKGTNVKKDSRDQKNKNKLTKSKTGFSRCHNPYQMDHHRDLEWGCLQYSVATASRILLDKDILEEILFFCPCKYLQQSDLGEI